MKKVIFEQLGNIILAIILVVAICQTIATSTFSTTYEDFSTELNFNGAWLFFIAGMIVFSIGRQFYAKKFGNNDGYNQKDGELSAQDEREKLIGSKAAKVTYRALIYCLGIALAMSLFINVLIVSPVILRLVYVAIIGSCMIFGFLTYLIAWIVFDSKI